MARKNKQQQSLGSALKSVYKDAKKSSLRSAKGAKDQAAGRKIAKNIRKSGSKINRGLVKAVVRSRNVSTKDKVKTVGVGITAGTAARGSIGALRAASKAGSTVGTAQRRAKVAYKFTAARKAALMKAVKASAAKRRKSKRK